MWNSCVARVSPTWNGFRSWALAFRVDPRGSRPSSKPGAALARKDVFDQAALSYRRCHDRVQASYDVVRPIAKAQRRQRRHLDPFIHKMTRALAISRPSSWLACGTCETTGLAENGTDWTMCCGAGSVVNTEASADLIASPTPVDVLDVGEGDAILIRTPDGKTALIDAGPSQKAAELLRERGVTVVPRQWLDFAMTADRVATVHLDRMLPERRYAWLIVATCR